MCDYSFLYYVVESMPGCEKILGVRLVRNNTIIIECVHDIVFALYDEFEGYSLFEIDNGVYYFLGDGISSLSQVYARMCKEHGCLMEDERNEKR